LSRELRVQGTPVELESKPLEVLRQFLLRPGEIVTKEELVELVWPGLAVVDASVATAISKVRKALGEENASVIITVPRVGYRLGVPVEVERSTSPAPKVQETKEEKRSHQGRWWLAAAITSVVILSVVLYDRFSSSGLKQSSTHRIASLAVLPLTNMSGDPTQEYFADGMTEELITELSKIQALKVISRTSAMQYKGAKKPLPVIARELGVDGIVEGAVTRSGNRIRVTAQLVEARSDTHLWGESYDRELADILNLQRELALQISREIKVTIRASEAEQLANSEKVNPQAHEIYLRGRSFWNQRTSDGLYRAAESFRESNQIDPSYARGYAGLADAYIELVGFAYIEPSEGINKAEAAAQQAISLDDSLAEAHTALGYTRALKWDWQGSEKEFKRALELNPGYVVALYQYGFILSMWGRNDEAIALAQKALELDPFSPVVLYRAGRVYFHARRYDEASNLFRRILELKPDDQMGLYGVGIVYEAQGEFDKAISSFQDPYQMSRFDLIAAYAAAGRKEEARKRLTAEMRRLQAGNSYLRPGYVAEVYSALGDKDQAVYWLEKGYRDHDAWLALLKVWPRLDPLRSDPRFQDLLRRMNFPTEH
jgi:TolB-like protein/DNA-binding winged helix-turn-helix (wHTH) protein/Flp pilus assembly protein TadD